MKNFTDSLNTRYQLIKESRDDGEFYMNIYHYIYLIETTPRLKNVIDNEERKFNKTISDIWNTVSTTKKGKISLVSKAEKFSLYSFYINLQIPIYSPIDDYFKNSDTEEHQDPVAIILTKDIKNISTKKESVKWDKRVLNKYAKEYKKQRKDFEYNIRQLHVRLLDILEKNEPIITKKIPLKLYKNGDFVFYKTKGTISPARQEFKILDNLLNNPGHESDYLTLYKSIRSKAENIRKVDYPILAQIIRNLKNELFILPKSRAKNPDIFKNVPGVSYRLVFTE